MIHIVIGTKAQLIKMAPVMVELKKRKIPFRYISTGQHQETMDDILDNFSLSGPDVVLYKKGDVVKVSAMFYWSLIVIFKSVFRKTQVFGSDVSRSDYVLVHGDTVSTLLGALMGFFSGLKVVHVESGLRSFNYFHPFPEEITRVLTFRFSDIMFCPDEMSINNLSKIRGEKINTGGNTLLDAWRLFGEKAGFDGEDEKDFGVVSLHRYENLKSFSVVERLVQLVEIVAEKHDLRFVMHKPTELALKKYELFSRLENNPNISFMPRMSYFKFMALVDSSCFVVSDGGSNQEECFYMGKPLLLLREKTERSEGLGKNCVLSCYSEDVVRSFSENISSYTCPPFSGELSPSAVIVNRLE